MADDFVLTRVFDAPRDLVWKAFTEPERMQQPSPINAFGPIFAILIGCPNLRAHKNSWLGICVVGRNRSFVFFQNYF
jgi:hypothetical protein